jgi:hypothetical protein
MANREPEVPPQWQGRQAYQGQPGYGGYQSQPGYERQQDPWAASQYPPDGRPSPSSQAAFRPGYQEPPPPGYVQPQPYPGQPQYAPGPPPQRRPRRNHTARNILAGLGGLVVVIIAISVAANGGHTVKTSGTAGASGQTAAAAVQAPATARIGSAITLSGNDSGEKTAVTVTKVIASASPGDEFTSAPAGDRLYAVQFRLDDTGSAAYSDAPSNGAAVVDSSGQSYQASITDTASGCASFPGTENIAPGASGLGCIVFDVPKAAKITGVQFTLDSGMGPQTGQWDVG